MARLIDADALNLDHEVEMADNWKTAHEIANCIKYAPTIDAVPVVRCKDCKHKRHLQGATDEVYVCALGWGLSGIVAEEDFCSYGKRRDSNA